MDKKGFTLIEVLGVVIVLATIILIVVPNISESLKNSRNKAFDVQIKEIETASRTWSIYNSNNLPSNQSEEITITLLQLKLAGLIDINLKNPKTGELFPDDMQIKITKKGLNYVYNVLIDTGSTSLDTIDPTGPQIVLNGSSYMYIEVNSNVVVPGATYKESNGINSDVTDIKYEVKNGEDFIETNSINFNELGSYVITYKATINGKSNSIKRYVYIVDTTAPEIVIEGYQNDICVDREMNSLFVLPTATITDNYTSFISPVVSGNISNIPGIKKITYKATDDNGNSNQFILCINMKDTNAPIINNIEVTNSAEIGSSIISVSAKDEGVGLHKNAYSFDGGKTWQKENYFVIKENSDVESINIIVRDKIGLQVEDMYVGTKIFSYKGYAEIYSAPKTGYYKIEAWGAQGGSYGTFTGGNGGYSKGILYLVKGEKLYVYVGEQGKIINSGSIYYAQGGYNGGGIGGNYSSNYSYGGGGATDIRYFGEYTPTEAELLWNSELGLNSRIMVAAGGGGAVNTAVAMPGYGGGLVGTDGYTTLNDYTNTTGATQTSGGNNGYESGKKGLFGMGAQTTATGWGGGGGGGYYGGATGHGTGGSGGSSYISGHLGSVAITSSTDRTPKTGCASGTSDITCSYHYSNKILESTVMISGNAEMPSIDDDTQTGHTGNGYAKISYVGLEI